MPTYKSPGVYIQEIPSGQKTIDMSSTSTTAFIGKANAGPIGVAERIQSFSEYLGIYGHIVSDNDIMGMAVQAFFLNGGQSAYICRQAGKEGEPTTTNEMTNFYGKVLAKLDDVSIIVLPGEHLPKNGTDNPIISVTIAHCEKMRNRMVIIDPPPDFELKQASNVNGLALPSSSYTALYYPWVNVLNPLYNNRTNPNDSKTLAIAPSSIAAGIWSKTDNKRGVWKAPAGVETSITGATSLAYSVKNVEQEQLNPLGVNCIRKIPVGNVIWGARTLATQTEPEWRYIPVRRTAIMIEQSIYKGIQWAVFEPNNHHLWTTLQVTIDGFMNSLFRNGALMGEKASDAYFVRCGLGDTMTQVDIDRGKLIILVGFAPLKPAEFITLKIRLDINKL